MSVREPVRRLSQVAVFAGLPEAAGARLERAAQIFEPRHGARIFSQGQAADAVYAIVAGAGRVRIGAFGTDRKGLMIEVFRLGELFGEIGVIDRLDRTAEAVVDGRVTLARIAAPAFCAALADVPELGVNLCGLLAKRLRRTVLLLQDATFRDLEARLARQLLYLAHVDGRRTADGVELLTRTRQTDLADLLGTTSRSIITVLNRWRIDGTVDFDARRARLVLRDQARLRSLLEVAERL